MAQTGYTPIQLYLSSTAAAVPLAANLAAGELAINTTDGKLYYKSNGGVVTLIASSAGASGDVVGPASATDNALARFDLTTGKLIQNSVGILSDAGVLTGLTGLTSSGSITFSSLTSGRVTYATTAGLLTDSANLTFNGTTLTANTIGAFTLSGTVAGGGNQINNVIIGTSTPLAGAFTSLTASTTLTVTGAGSIEGLTVGKGGGAVATNTAVGASALAANTTGASNTAVGYQAGYAVTTGAGNQLFGYSAGSAITTGAKNVIIGSYTGSAAPISATGSNYIVLSDGDGNVRQTIDSSGNVGIGNTPTAKLDVTSGDGTATANAFFVRGATGVFGVYPYFDATNGCLINSYNAAISAYKPMTFQASSIAWNPNGTEKMRLDASGNLLVGVASANANGGVLQLKSGITFPATQVAATDANTLDDYEEGTWTPAGGGLTNGVTATYTKVGRLVHAVFDVTFPGGGAATQGNITGLPFTILTPGGGGSIGFTGYITPITLNIERSVTYFYFITFAGVGVTYANLNGVRIIGSLVYSV